MALTVCVLASGSAGNSTYIASDTTKILVDVGLSGKATIARLNDIGVDLKDINAICVTHDHSDHIAGLGVIYKKANLDLYGNTGTIEAVERSPRLNGLEWIMFTTGQSFEIGDISVHPFAVPHDAYEPVGFIFQQGASKVAVATDMGIVTTLIRERMKSCQIAVLEANHDDDLLKESERPWALKQRISGHHGHLSNADASDFILELAESGLTTVFLAHISNDCNDRSKLEELCKANLIAAGHVSVNVELTYQSKVSNIASC